MPFSQVHLYRAHLLARVVRFVRQRLRHPLLRRNLALRDDVRRCQGRLAPSDGFRARAQEEGRGEPRCEVDDARHGHSASTLPALPLPGPLVPHRFLQFVPITFRAGVRMYFYLCSMSNYGRRNERTKRSENDNKGTEEEPVQLASIYRGGGREPYGIAVAPTAAPIPSELGLLSIASS